MGIACTGTYTPRSVPYPVKHLDRELLWTKYKLRQMEFSVASSPTSYCDITQKFAHPADTESTGSRPAFSI